MCYLCRCGPLIDLCRGPHVRHTGKIKAMQVVKVSVLTFYVMLLFNCMIMVTVMIIIIINCLAFQQLQLLLMWINPLPGGRHL